MIVGGQKGTNANGGVCKLTSGVVSGAMRTRCSIGWYAYQVKVEKPENYDESKGRDLDTCLFQVQEHLNIAVVPERGHVPYAASLLRGMQLFGGANSVKVTTALWRGSSFVVYYGNSSGLKITVAVVGTS